MNTDDSMDDALRTCASVWIHRILFFYIVQHKKYEEKISGQELARYNVLRILNESGSHSMSELGKMLYQSKPYMSTLVDSLIRDELVERVPDQHDRRVINIRITPKGDACLADISLKGIQHAKSLMMNLTTDELRELCDVGERFFHLLTRIEPSEHMIALGTKDIEMYLNQEPKV